MRKTLLLVLSAAFALSLHSTGLAQDEELRPKKIKPKIEKLRFGFVNSGIVGRNQRGSSILAEGKSGCWSPVYVHLLAGSDRLPATMLEIESKDSDDVRFRYRVQVPPLDPSQSFLATGYTKASAIGNEITFHWKVEDRLLGERVENYSALDVGDYLFLGIGSRARGLVNALLPPKATRESLPNQDPNDPNVALYQVNAAETKGRYVGFLDNSAELPRQWFGYDSADVVLLFSSDGNFTNDLLNERDLSAYRALTEWVRRGGRLIVFAGRNFAALSQLDNQQPLLPVRLTGTNTAVHAGRLFGGTAPPAKMHFTKFAAKPNQPHQLEDRVSLEQAVMARGRHGMGEVIVYGFDPDLPEFTRWEGQSAFWTSLLAMLANEGLQRTGQNQNSNVYFGQENYDELGTHLQQTLEDFQDVPVISFGWVALFILIYILIVGPADYFFLKKVVKRLEFTWITFPLVVLIISAVAYFTAYYVKGNDQRINKVDLVDIDVPGRQVYGHTWFTIFSPRIQHYTVGVEPTSDQGWGARDDAGVTLSWLGRPDSSGMGYRRPSSPSLFRRTYDFEHDLAGMRGVPIPVWSTKSFTASWATTKQVDGLIEADIQETGTGLTGHVVSKLPVDLSHAALVRYRDGQSLEVYRMGTLVAGARRSLADLTRENQLQGLLNDASSAQPPVNKGAYQRPLLNCSQTMVEALFYNAQTQSARSRRNSGLRNLDQTWRARGHGEVILFARVLRPDETDAEAVTKDARSATRLWLGALPQPGEARPPLSGTLSQDTYVRVFLPVRAKREPESKP